MANCKKCTKFHSPFVRPICDEIECPIPKSHKGNNGTERHPNTLDHSPENMLRLASVAEDLSHEIDGHFDDLQDMANLLGDWASIKQGWTLKDLDENTYPEKEPLK